MQFFKKRIITRSDGLKYLVRFNIFECKYFSIKLHHILVSDDDCLHDHPWAFYTFLFSGGYYEFTEGGFLNYRNRWSVLYRPAKFKHAIVLVKPVWTFVITLKRERVWGFWNSKGFIPWFDYEQKGARCD